MKKNQPPKKPLRKLKRKLLEFYCENCGVKDPLEYFRNLPSPFEDLMLCDNCADLPVSKIKRQSFPKVS